MATLSLMTFHSLFTHRHKWQQLQQHHSLRNFSRFRASSIKKSRKVKTNAELCDDIREFVAATGLPEGYVPTMKDFSQYGRSDLAYIVRRRGYKVIGELLGNDKGTNLDGSDLGKSGENKYEEPNIIAGGDFRASVEAVPSIGSEGSSDVGQENPSEADSEQNSHMLMEASADLENDSASLKIDEEEDKSLVAESSIIENILASSSTVPSFDFGSHSQEKHVETSTHEYIGNGDLDNGAQMVNVSAESANSLPSEEETLQNGCHENYNMVEEVALSSVPVELSGLSLEEKAASFIQHGNLDTVEENSYLMLKKNGIEDTVGNIERIGTDEVQIGTYSSNHLQNVLSGGNAAANFDGSALQSLQVVTAMTGNNPLREENFSVEQQSTQFMDDKTGKSESYIEDEKELELSRLREEIEKEKRALALLQAKAETEIKKAQKLISEKDAELQAAEEMLSELVEVLIQYHGDGEFVEVAGSFNGWHHWVKMDPQPSSNSADNVESGNLKIWSTVLWLYPGIYEIKFIVDGQWKTDPTMELISHGDICNNILRVHR